MDRNTIIGFVLIGLLMFGMLYMNNRSSEAYMAEQKRKADSTERAKPKVNPAIARQDSIRGDSTKQANAIGLSHFVYGKEELTSVENNLLKVTFTNKGAQPKTVELKQYKTFEGKPVFLETGIFNKISYPVKTGNELIQTSDIAFPIVSKVENADKSQTISFTVKDSSGRELTHQYTIRPDNYMIDFSIVMNDAAKLVDQNTISLVWQTQPSQVEKDIKYEKQQSQIGYVQDDKFDFEHLGNGDTKKFDKPVDWIAVKQQFFTNTLISKSKFQFADIQWAVPDTSLHIIAKATANLKLAAPTASAPAALQLYYGPSDYNVLKTYNNKMENIVPYGSGVFSFVKYINRHILLPVFDFLKQHVASMGIVILLLTLFIRLLTSPILYKSYLSGAKMKALKPEVDKLKEKYGDDKQAFGMEQMKLWKSAGVSPLGGCLPALLQIPIFMSLYYFFQSNISLRGKNFLWANDLASYDSILDFGHIPVISSLYGSHISLFTLTAVITSLLISLYSMSNMQDNSNPVMKYMPYIFPVLLLGVFNNLPSALTWYYTISNTITLILQYVIQNYIIDHDKILVQIEENRKKPVKQSKWQERIQAMQESNQKLQEMKNKNQKK